MQAAITFVEYLVSEATALRGYTCSHWLRRLQISALKRQR